ncbi:hypothetical protein NDU88_000911 [Pleurodeles waltl]|uniref:Uncharacterized protein n=1 Tax=Pleurodeles waltl TaxID=8319 RepID=A0AAV7TGD1_PLEWA|nr:hypothetical protein NDU88_000911 [Pleurodeles waltl]
MVNRRYLQAGIDISGGLAWRAGVCRLARRSGPGLSGPKEVRGLGAAATLCCGRPMGQDRRDLGRTSAPFWARAVRAAPPVCAARRAPCEFVDSALGAPVEVAPSATMA